MKVEKVVLWKKVIEQENYEPNTINFLRDYYFRLLMNYKAEEVLRIFALTYEEILESRKINFDSVLR